MTHKEHIEDQNITFEVIARDDSGEIATITGVSYEDISEQWRKLEHAINQSIEQEYKELPENPEWLQELTQ